MLHVLPIIAMHTFIALFSTDKAFLNTVHANLFEPSVVSTIDCTGCIFRCQSAEVYEVRLEEKKILTQ